MALLIAGTFLFSIQRTASARTFSEPQIFTDVPPDSPYFDQTTFMYNAGITTGCTISPPTYASGCATPYLTRAQMAVFIIKALYYRLTGSTTFTYNETPYFVDVPKDNNPFFPYIQKMKELGITTGCSPDGSLYCPNDLATNFMVAVFAGKARQYVRYGDVSHAFSCQENDWPCGAQYYSDVDANTFPFAQAARYMLGPIIDCSPAQFCPGGSITRAQSAYYIAMEIMGETVRSLSDLEYCVNGGYHYGTQPAAATIWCTLGPTASGSSLYDAFGPGMWPDSAILLNRSNTVLSAQPGQTVTIRRGNGNLLKLLHVGYGVANVVISHLTIDGQNAIIPTNVQGQGSELADVYLEHSANVFIHNNVFRGSSNGAVFFSGPNHTISRNAFGSASSVGLDASIAGYGDDAQDFYIYLNTMDHGGLISLTRVHHGVVESNTLLRNVRPLGNGGGSQIYLTAPTRDVMVVNNNIDGQWASNRNDWNMDESYGVEVDGASYIQIVGGYMTGHGVSGIWVGRDAHDVTVQSVNVYNNGFQGIQIATLTAPPASATISLSSASSQNNNLQSQNLNPPTIEANWSLAQRYHGVYITSVSTPVPYPVCIDAYSTVSDVVAEPDNGLVYSRPTTCSIPYVFNSNVYR